MSLSQRLVERIRAEGPITVADFMETALYDLAEGYYTSAAQRSGRDGDFATSVDAGPLFGELLAELVARVYAAWRTVSTAEVFDIVEAGAGNGRLMRALLDEFERLCPEGYTVARAHLVEQSDAARAEHRARLGSHATRASSSATMPDGFEGILFANELLDAFPVHRLVRRGGGWHEVLVDAGTDGLCLAERPLGPGALARYVAALGLQLPPGAVIDVSPAAASWVRDAVRRARRGLLVFIDYGHDARELFAGHHLEGTLSTYTGHLLDPPAREPRRRPAWLERPGERDLTAHVDFTSVTSAAEDEGWTRAGLVDQMHLLIGLGLQRRLVSSSGSSRSDLARRLAAKTLASPDGLGATHRALLLARGLPAVAWLDPL
jgi:SAM-dependent MidA family methyltransferase